MAIWNLGASYVCLKCLTRSPWRHCPRCKSETKDLREAGFSALQDHWSAYPAFAAGHALYSPRATRSLRVIRYLSAAAAIIIPIAAVIAQFVKHGRPPTPVELGLSVPLSALCGFFIFEGFTLYLLLIAHVFRGMALGFSVLAPLPLVGSKFSILSTLTRFLWRPLLPQLVVLTPEEPLEAPHRGVLTQTLTLSFVRDGWGFFERFDVVAALPAQVKLDSGEVTTVTLEHGGIQYDQAMSKRLDAAGILPTWLLAPGRDGVRFCREFPIGTRVTFTRGRQQGDEPRVLLTLS